MNTFLVEAVKFVGRMVLGTGVLEQIKDAVDEWSAKQISGLDKKEGVISQLKADGLIMTQRAFDNGIQLALIWIDLESK